MKMAKKMITRFDNASSKLGFSLIWHQAGDVYFDQLLILLALHAFPSRHVTISFVLELKHTVAWLHYNPSGARRCGFIKRVLD